MSLVFAIAAGIGALVIGALIVALVLSILHHRKSDNISAKQQIEPIKSVGVRSSLPQQDKLVSRSSATSGAVTRQTPTQPAGNLKSRFVAMGLVTAGVFGSLATKLWTMQVLEQSAYSSAADENKYNIVYKPAPRGCILDADGVPLVKNRLSLTVLADAEVADNHDIVQRLSATLGVPSAIVRQRIQDATLGAQSQRIVAGDVRMRDAAFITEHSDAFSGVTVEERTVREYPYGALAAHVVGYTGSPSTDDLENTLEGRVVKSGDTVGKAGIEMVYDNLLAGDHGEKRVMADTHGNVVKVVSDTKPVNGSDVYLTIKAPVQYACDSELAQLIAPDGLIGVGTGTAGAAVVMDVQTGGIIAMASYPTFAPETFSGNISQDIWDVYQSPEAQKPMLNRAISGTYPAASTYKTFTGLAALANGFADTSRGWVCTGEWDGWNSGDVQKCWKHSGHGGLDFRGGIVNSCDVVFYDIAKQFFDSSQGSNPQVSETAMQDTIKKYRFGELSGIDLPAEEAGRVPTPEWKAQYFKDTPEEAVWRGGDSTNMSIGQGYVLTTPLQVAVAYGGVATGKIVKPHLLKEVRNNDGEVSLSFQTEVITEPVISKEDLEVVRDALHGVATDNADISKAFREVGIDPSTVACKTGTAEMAGQEDYAWFVCYAPYDDPKYVVACVIEQGGGGSSTGAPLGAKLMAATLQADEGSLTAVQPVVGSTGKSVPYVVSTSGRTD